MQFRTIKKEIRILAWDDGPFEFKSKGKDILIGVIFRGGQFLDGLLKTEVDIDGEDATEKIIEKILKTRHKDLRIVMLDGITVAGFNTVNIKEIYDKTGLPVIVINREKPNLEKFIETLKNMTNSEKRLKAVKDAGPIYSMSVKNKRIYFQSYGIKKDDVEEIIKTTSTMSLIPEPLRAAHLIANGFVLGESVGRA
jgi:endonuclease V-like protein UPF0215 family